MITAEDRKKYPHHTDGSILGIKLIGSLADDILREAVTRDKILFEAILVLMGGQTNKNWVQGRIADEMYDRDMIDEKEFDRLSDC